MQEKVVILPCNGDSACGKLTWIEVQGLVLGGKAEWYSLLCGSGENTKCKSSDSRSFIIVDRCERRRLFNASLEQGLAGKHRLSLDDVGIESLNFDDIKPVHIELAKDAIIAECAETDNFRPLPFSGCCCG